MILKDKVDLMTQTEFSMDSIDNSLSVPICFAGKTHSILIIFHLIKDLLKELSHYRLNYIKYNRFHSDVEVKWIKHLIRDASPGATLMTFWQKQLMKYR